MEKKTGEKTALDKEIEKLLEEERQKYKDEHGRYPEEDNIGISISK